MLCKSSLINLSRWTFHIQSVFGCLIRKKPRLMQNTPQSERHQLGRKEAQLPLCHKKSSHSQKCILITRSYQLRSHYSLTCNQPWWRTWCYISDASIRAVWAVDEVGLQRYDIFTLFVIFVNIRYCDPYRMNRRAVLEFHKLTDISEVNFDPWVCRSTGNASICRLGVKRRQYSEDRNVMWSHLSWDLRGFLSLSGWFGVSLCLLSSLVAVFFMRPGFESQSWFALHGLLFPCRELLPSWFP